MHRARPIAIGLAFALSAMAGCFFTLPVNDRPEATIKKVTPGPHFRGDTIRFTARESSDPDGDDQLDSVDWRAFTCAADGSECDRPAFIERTGTYRDIPLDITVPLFRNNVDAAAVLLIRVELTVYDAGKAENTETLHIEIRNHKPAVELQVPSVSSGFYTVLNPLRIAARASDRDGDTLALDWQLKQPSGSEPAVWRQISSGPIDGGWYEETYELVPNSPGEWEIEVIATDNVDDGEDAPPVSVTRQLAVKEDEPPCIVSTEPRFIPDNPGARYILDRSDPPRRFAVLSVTDDLDIYPPPSAEDEYRDRVTFRWFVKTPDTAGQRVEVEDHDIPDYTVNAQAFAPGDQLSLQVEVSDRRDDRTPCDREQSFCAINGPPCYQRVSWEVEIR